jgi:hypothetical protein
LFSNGKTPAEVAITLNLREPEATKYYREYWKLKRLDKLYFAYKELGDEGIRHFLRLIKLAKKERIGVEQIVNLLQLAGEDNPFGLSYLEKRRKWIINNIHDLDLQIERSKNHLQSANDEIASSKQLLNSYHISCERKRQDAVTLNNEIFRLESLVSRFKNNNEEYRKIKQRVEEEVSRVLKDGKVLLQFALAAVIEAFRRNPDNNNNLLINNTLESSISIPTQGSQVSHIEDYKNMISEEANRLYDTVQNHLTNSIMDNIAGTSSKSSLSSTFPRLQNQSDACRIEESENYHNSKEDIAD